MYRQPAGNFKLFKSHLKSNISKLMKHNNKHIYIAGDLNFNLLDYSTNKKVKPFVDVTTHVRF